MFTVINKYGKGAVVNIVTIFGTVYHLASGRVLWNGIFQTIIQSRFSESVISEIHWLWVSSFFGKTSKFNLDYRNAKTNWENVFCFWDNSIWIGCVKLSLLRGEYLSSAVNVLTNSLNILNSSNIDLFQLNFVDSD